MNLTWLQRIHRRIALLGGSYKHPDGRIELDFDEKAGIDRRVDSDEVQDAKLSAWMHREAEKERRFHTFLTGAIVGAALMYWWLRG